MLALEEAGCAAPERGWTPMHMALWRGRDLVALAPAYARVDSQGEFVFDHAWANAAVQNNIRYYPKLTLSVPFTPCTGRRVMVRPGEDRAGLTRALFRATFEAAEAAGLSSVHALFVTDDEADAAEAEGACVRHGIQFHWENPGYRTYDDYLSRFTSRRRKNLRKETDAHIDQGITLRTRRGDELSADDAALVHRIYVSTVDKFAWGRRYITPRFFERVLTTRSRARRAGRGDARRTGDRRGVQRRLRDAPLRALLGVLRRASLLALRGVLLPLDRRVHPPRRAGVRGRRGRRAQALAGLRAHGHTVGAQGLSRRASAGRSNATSTASARASRPSCRASPKRQA